MKLAHAMTALVLLAALAAPPAAVAKHTLSLYWENDSGIHKPNGNTDRHYSNGFRLVHTFQPTWEWLREFGEIGGFGNGGPVDTAFGISLGQNIYTPNEVGFPDRRRPDDMKFAGWLYSGIFAQRATETHLEHWELKPGVIGPSSHAEEIQDVVHEWVAGDEPKGWENQIDDEFAFDFIYRSKIKLKEDLFWDIERLQIIPDYGLTLGSVHRDVQLGALIRYGWNMPDDFGPGHLNMPTTAIGKPEAGRHSFYFFTRPAVNFVEHNRFFTGLSEEPVVGQVSVGLVYRYRSLELGYTQTFMTRQWEEQDANDSYGAFIVTWLF